MLQNNNFLSPFCLVKTGGEITFYKGKINDYEYIDEIPDNSVSLLPYSQIKEKGYEYQGDDLPIIALAIESAQNISLEEVKQHAQIYTAKDRKIEVDIDDETYADLVSQIIQEIKEGAGCNFVLSREFKMEVGDLTHGKALDIYGRLLEGEPYAYMTFLFFTGEKYFIGASPETHLRIDDGIAQMNPISGTLAKKNISELEGFLQDPKEIYELHKVLDEELKMMARICDAGGSIKGPFLKETSTVIHTEYTLCGKMTCSIQEAIRLSLYAATLTGGPIENACRLIARYEKTPRRYYGTALMVRENGNLNSCITIRTAEIDLQGTAKVRAGASIVVDSDPEKEALETRLKAQGMINLLEGGMQKGLQENYQALLKTDRIQELLASRNKDLSQFLVKKQEAHQSAGGKHCLLIDNEDDFVYLIVHMLRSLDITCTILPRDTCNNLDSESLYKKLKDVDMVCIGPGPGNPNEMQATVDLLRNLLQKGIPLFGICLGHQLLCKALGYTIEKKNEVTQGTQLPIDFFGTVYQMGYYNSFGVVSQGEGIKNNVSATVLGQDGYIDVLKGPKIYSVQFHPESVLSQYGYGCLQRMLEGIGML